MKGRKIYISAFTLLFLAFALSVLMGVFFRLNPLIALSPLGIAYVAILHKGLRNRVSIDKEEILNLLDNTSQDDDAGFRKIISAILDGKFLTTRDISRSVGTGGTTVGRWRDGKSSPHPYMRKHVLKALKELLLCACPKKCDCQNPYPDDWDGIDGVWHISEMCPKHNREPRPHPKCPVHK